MDEIKLRRLPGCVQRRGTMKKLPQISEAEYEVMKAVWRQSPAGTNEMNGFFR